MKVADEGDILDVRPRTLPDAETAVRNFLIYGEATPTRADIQLLYAAYEGLVSDAVTASNAPSPRRWGSSAATELLRPFVAPALLRQLVITLVDAGVVDQEEPRG